MAFGDERQARARPGYSAGTLNDSDRLNAVWCAVEIQKRANLQIQVEYARGALLVCQAGIIRR